MKKHIVTCVKCGRQFDANEGGAYYPESRRYVCKRCVDKQKSEQADREKARKAEERKAEADERERVTGMRQSKAASRISVAPLLERLRDFRMNERGDLGKAPSRLPPSMCDRVLVDFLCKLVYCHFRFLRFGFINTPSRR